MELGIKLVRLDGTLHPSKLPSSTRDNNIILSSKRLITDDLLTSTSSKRHCGPNINKTPTKLTLRGRDSGLLTPPSITGFQSKSHQSPDYPRQLSPTPSATRLPAGHTGLSPNTKATFDTLSNENQFPQLAFRGWSEKSQGLNSCDGFRSFSLYSA